MGMIKRIIIEGEMDEPIIFEYDNIEINFENEIIQKRTSLYTEFRENEILAKKLNLKATKNIK